MPSIDERVVSMAFENTVFESRVHTTITTLGKLDTTLKNLGGTTGFDKIEAAANKVTLQHPMSALDKLKARLGGAGQGAAEGLGEIDKAGNKVTLEGPGRAIDKLQSKMGQINAGDTFTDIEKASNQVSLSGLTSALDSVTNKFSVLKGAASVALGNITAQAGMKGAAFAKSFAFGPLQQGLGEYQTNLNSIQTILANTEGQQVTGLSNVNKYLGELNEYSDKTIYNFGEMAKNIGTFTAAGVDLPKSTEAIKGIANLAALSGSNSQQASTAMYQLSQAISAGRVGLQDWNSVVNAGMGGAVFQKSLMRTAENMGALEKGAVKIDKATGKATVNGESFRNSIMAKPGEESWLTSDVLTSTLSQLTGDMTDAELAAKGFTAEQIKAIQAQAKTAQEAATQVKTLPQVFDVARETIGSGWAKSFQLIFGDFEQSKKTFTQLSNFVNGIINKISDARNKLLGDWNKLGGRDTLIDGLVIAFNNLWAVLKTINAAFRDVFPAKTGKDLFELTKSFTELMRSLTPSRDLLNDLQRIFRGFFAVVHIGWNIVKGLGGVLLDLFGVVGKGSGGFLETAASVGDFLAALDNALTKGGLLKTFFVNLSRILQQPVALLMEAGRAIGRLFGFDTESKAKGVQDSLQGVSDKLGPLKVVAEKVVAAWDKLKEVFATVKTALDPWLSEMGEKLKGIGDIIANAFAGLDFDKIMAGLQTAFTGGILLMLKKLVGGGGILGELTGTFDSINDMLRGLTGNLEAMQNVLNSAALAAIGGALLLLAAGLFILSKIDGEDLSKALTATAIGLGELGAALTLMKAVMGKTGGGVLLAVGVGMVLLAGALVIMAGAMKIFATMDWDEIGKGLAGVAGAIGTLAAGMRLIPPNIVASAGALILVGVALNIIAAAVKQFGSMKLEDIGKGLFAILEAIGLIAFAMSSLPPNMMASAAGLILVGVAVNILGMAIKKMGDMDFITMMKGLIGLTAAIVALGYATFLIPPTIAAQAAGLIILGMGLSSIATAIAIMGNLSIWTLVKGITAFALTLVVLAAGLYLMEGTLPGAAALLAAAGALSILAPTLAFLGKLSWGTIFKGLAAVALALGTIAIMGVIAGPALAILGIALIPFGLALLLVAGAAKMFAAAFTTMGDTSQKNVAAMIAAISAFIAVIPTFVISLIKGLLGVVDQLTVLLPKIVIALGVIIDAIIAFVIQAAPKLAVAIGVLVTSLVQVLGRDAPKLIAAGSKLILQLLEGMSQNIGPFTTKAAEIITKFLNELGNHMSEVTTAGARVLEKFLFGVASHVGGVVTTVSLIIVKFVAGVGQHFARMVELGGKLIGKFIEGIAGAVVDIINAGRNLIIRFLEGIAKAVPEIKEKALWAAKRFVNALADGLSGLADVAFNGVIRFLNSLEATIRENDDKLTDAGIGVGDAIMDGIIEAFGRTGPGVRKALEKVLTLMPGWAKDILGIHSPSTVFAEIGAFTMMGFANGIADSSGDVHKSAAASAIGVIDQFKNTLGVHSPSEVMREIGMEVNRGFAQGLKGSREDVINAFKSLDDKLRDNIREKRSMVEDGNKKIEDLQKQHAQKLAEASASHKGKVYETGETTGGPVSDETAGKIQEMKDIAATIREETKARAENELVLKRNRAARQELLVSLKNEKMEMLGLKTGYEAVSKQLEEANDKLRQAQSDRDAFQKQQVEKYGAVPDLRSTLDKAFADALLTDTERREQAEKAREEAEKKKRVDQVAAYRKALEERLAATKSYAETLQKLRAAGLDDTTYRKLIDEGVEAKDFAEALLKGGKTAVDSINSLDAQLLAEATKMSNQVTANLYNAGVDAAQGLVNGLKARQAELEKQMADLGASMVNAIRKKLKERSPSRVLLEVGKYAAQGLIDGLRGSKQGVSSAAAGLGDDVVSAMSTSMSRISDALSSEIDPDLTITPVLDLTQVQKDAQKLGDLTNVTPITAAASYQQATAASQELSVAQKAAIEAAAAGGGTKFEYVQNNYSPESLSNVEIYRQTKNQVAQVKNALGL